MPHGNFDVDFMIMSNFQPAINVKAPSLEGSTLVVPLVSLGNCPQLAGDLLLETLALKLKGSLSPDHHVPVAGSREDGHGYFTPLEGKDPLVELMITTYCDDTVYQNDSGSLTLLHQRSPPLKNEKEAFIADLISFAKTFHFNTILILASMDAGTRRDRDLAEGIHTPLRHWSLQKDGSVTSTLQEMCPLHQRAAAASSTSMPAREEDATYVPHIPAGGIARRLFQALQEEAASWDGCQVAALLMYLVEGDNRSDARTLASAASHVLHIQQGMRLYLRSREQSG